MPRVPRDILSMSDIFSHLGSLRQNTKSAERVKRTSSTSSIVEVQAALAWCLGNWIRSVQARPRPKNPSSRGSATDCASRLQHYRNPTLESSFPTRGQTSFCTCVLNTDLVPHYRRYFSYINLMKKYLWRQLCKCTWGVVFFGILTRKGRPRRACTSSEYAHWAKANQPVTPCKRHAPRCKSKLPSPFLWHLRPNADKTLCRNSNAWKNVCTTKKFNPLKVSIVLSVVVAIQQAPLPSRLGKAVANERSPWELSLVFVHFCPLLSKQILIPRLALLVRP